MTTGTTGTADATGPGAKTPLPRHVRAVAAVMVLGSFMTVLDMTIVNVAIGHLSRALHAPLSVMQWTVTGYALALAGAVPVTAWAVGRLGARRVFLAAVAVFTLGSALAGLSWNAPSLIAFRALQGIGGGMIVPVAMTVVLRAAPPGRGGTMMGILGIPVLVGPMAGPVLGGVFTDTLSWRWIFFVNVPVGLLALLLGAYVLDGREAAEKHTGAPSDGSRRNPAGPAAPPYRRLDVVGLLMLSPGLATLLYGLTRGGGDGGFASAGSAVPLVAGTALVTGFALRALRTAHPLLDLRLLARPAMARGLATLVPFTSAYFGSMIVVPLYWQQARGLSATEAGLLMAPQFLFSGSVMQVSSRLSDRVATRAIVLPGVALAAAGYLAFALQAEDGTPYWRLLASLAVLGTGVGMTSMPVMASATRGLTDAELAAGTTGLNIVLQLASATGTALAALLLTGTAGFRTTLLCGAALMAAALPAAFRLPRRRP